MNARIVKDEEYGEEAVLRIEESGYELRTNAGKVGEPTFGGNYVRIVAPDGRETGYWVDDEWQREPVVVMGAIFGAAAGTEVPGFDPDPKDGLCIERRYIGGSELLNYHEWSQDVVMDDEIAADIAQRLLDGDDPYIWNEGEGIGLEMLFIVYDRIALIDALKEREDEE